MEDNFFDFAKTKEALSQLSADLAALNTTVVQMGDKIADERNQTKVQIKDYEDKIASMKDKTLKACDTIDAISKYIDGVL